MNIYLMRHGETHWNKARRIQGSSDIDLTDLGRELAVLSGDGFVKDGILFDCVYTSPLQRAVETAEIVAKAALKKDAVYPSVLVDARLREMCFGKYEGMSLINIREKDTNIVNCFSKPSLYLADPTGETYEDVFSRIDSFMEEVLLPMEQQEGVENVLVLCHGTVIRAFLARINHIALDDFWNLSQPNCSINHIELKDGVFRSVRERILYYQSAEITNRGIL